MDIIYLAIIITIFCLSVYLILHAVSYFVTVFASSKKRKLMIRNKYQLKDYLNNLIVVVYCHNQERAASYMLEALNKQDYSKLNCQYHFILDNCTDNTANMLEFISGAKLWKVGDGVTLGKDEAISWLLERLIHVKNTDAFVFIDVERQIEDDFLSNVNKSLLTGDVVVGETEIIPQDASLFSNLVCALNNYKNRIINTGRTILGLVNWVDVNCFALKYSILEKIKYVDFKDSLSPYKYTLLLARKNYFCVYNPAVRSKVSIQQYFDMQESFANKFSLFVKCLLLFPKFNLKFNELSMSLISPSALVNVLVFLLLYAYTSYFLFCIDTPVIIASGAILCVAFLASLAIAKFSFKENLLILCSPVLCLGYKIVNISFVTKFLNMFKGEKNVPVIKTATRSVWVTDGKNNLFCELELISEDGMSKAVLKFKKKKYSSECYLRMYDAINDIVSTLNEHGFRVKICASCGYFTSLVDGTTNMIKGTCNKCIVDKVSQDPAEVLLWGGCENYIPQEVNKVIDIATFRNK